MKTITRGLLILFLSIAVSSRAGWDVALQGVACPGDGHLGEKSQVPGYFAVEDGPDYLPIPITNRWMWTGRMTLYTNYDCNYGGRLLAEYPDSCRQHSDPSTISLDGWKVADIKAYPDGSSTPCCTVIEPTFLNLGDQTVNVAHILVARDVARAGTPMGREVSVDISLPKAWLPSRPTQAQVQGPARTLRQAPRRRQ